MRCYVEIIGRLSRAPDVKSYPNGDRIAFLTVATEESSRDRQSGEIRVRTTWHTIRVSKLGVVKAAERELRQGSLVFVAGSLRYSDWVDAERVQRRTAEIVVKASDHQLLFLDVSAP